MVRLLDSVPESYKTAANYLTRINLVFANGPVLDPGVAAQIRTHPGVALVIPEKGLEISRATPGWVRICAATPGSSIGPFAKTRLIRVK